MRVPAVYLAAFVLAAAPLAAQSGTATYEVTFQATWSAATHPVEIPDNPHFSPLIGGVHDATVGFWRPGAPASRGIERMAEEGRTSPLDDEVGAAIAAGAAREVILGGPIGRSPGSVRTTFSVSREFPLVTLLSMIAPSPDWFVGVAGLSLLEGDAWADERVVALLAYDAGTDHGETFDSANFEASPHLPITHLDAGPFAGEVPLGTFTFRRLDTDPPSPLLLGGGRFRVDARWRNYAGATGSGRGQAFTADSGYFWFFGPDNVEVTIKIIDGCAANGHWWVYAAGLTDVEVQLAVTDLETDTVFEIENLLGEPFALQRDIQAFSACP